MLSSDYSCRSDPRSAQAKGNKLQQAVALDYLLALFRLRSHPYWLQY